MAETKLTGTYKHQKNENYNDYLKALNMGWFKRKTAVSSSPIEKVMEGSAGTLNFKRICGINNTVEQTISLGEEHSETLPNGEVVRGITVREGDHNLITRLEHKKMGKMELIREFSKDGMVMYIKILDRDFEAIRYFKRQL